MITKTFRLFRSLCLCGIALLVATATSFFSASTAQATDTLTIDDSDKVLLLTNQTMAIDRGFGGDLITDGLVATTKTEHQLAHMIFRIDLTDGHTGVQIGGAGLAQPLSPTATLIVEDQIAGANIMSELMSIDASPTTIDGRPIAKGMTFIGDILAEFALAAISPTTAGGRFAGATSHHVLIWIWHKTMPAIS